MTFEPFVEEGNPVTDFEEPAALISFLRNSFPEAVKDNICIQDRSNRQWESAHSIELTERKTEIGKRFDGSSSDDPMASSGLRDNFGISTREWKKKVFS